MVSTASEFNEKWGFYPPETPEGVKTEEYLLTFGEGVAAGYSHGYADGVRDGNEQAFDADYCESCRDYH